MPAAWFSSLLLVGRAGRGSKQSRRHLPSFFIEVDILIAGGAVRNFFEQNPLIPAPDYCHLSPAFDHALTVRRQLIYSYLGKRAKLTVGIFLEVC
ncbi:MAG: hypothetical protein WBW06_09825, partial [Xanthobacteraceae bacterium]